MLTLTQHGPLVATTFTVNDAAATEMFSDRPPGSAFMVTLEVWIALAVVVGVVVA